MITLQIIPLCGNFKLICKYSKGDAKTEEHLKSGQLSRCVLTSELDYEAFVMKTGSRLKPSQNTAINEAPAPTETTFNATVSVFVIDYRQIKLNAV